MLVLQNISFQRREFSLNVPELVLPKKGLFRILGENGSGKSTLLSIMAGILPYKTGIVTLNGQEISVFTRMQCAEQINYLPQLAEHMPSFLGKNFLEQGLYAGGESQINLLLKRFDMEYLLEKRCDQCSGGELQILRFIRACASLKKIVLLDEPESFLSRKRKLILIEILQEWAEQILVVVSSHAEISQATPIFLEEGADNAFSLNLSL
ncbi:MAG: ATP-binding cassette domain-containing protein [Brevinema sp.]